MSCPLRERSSFLNSRISREISWFSCRSELGSVSRERGWAVEVRDEEKRGWILTAESEASVGIVRVVKTNDVGTF